MKILNRNKIAQLFLTIIFMGIPFIVAAQTQITNEQQLRDIANDLNGSYILMNDITLTGDWSPIGNRATPFTGELDGNGHVIKNLHITLPAGNQVGIFGAALQAVIKKLGLENAEVEGGSATDAGNDVGLFIGEGTGIILTECYAADFKVIGRDHVASLVGGTKKASTSSTRSSITNCYAIGTVISRQYQAGGLIGTAENTDITDCYFSGTVEAQTTGSSYTGGIMALAEGNINTISNCIVMAPYLKGGTVGRIAGKIGAGSLLLTNNFGSFDTYYDNGSGLISWSSQTNDIGSSSLNGQHFSKIDPKEKSFFAYKMPNWDLTNVWKLYTKDDSNDAGIYPVLAWQQGKVNVFTLGITDQISMNIGDDYSFRAFGSHGQLIDYDETGINNSVVSLTKTIPSSFTSDDATTAMDAYHKVFYSGNNQLYYTKSNKQGLAIAAIWTQAIYWDIMMNAYKRTGADKYKTLIAGIYEGGYEKYDSYNWQNTKVWFIYDDMMWWIISLGRAYEVTGEQKYLDASISGFDRVWNGRTNPVVGDGGDQSGSYDADKGGLWWNFVHDGKMSCINYPTVIGAMTLYNSTKDESYFNKAKEIYAWSRDVFFDKTNGRVADNMHYNSSSSNGMSIDWTLQLYNQGTFIGAAMLLYNATKDQSYLDDAILAANCVKYNMSNGLEILPYKTGVEQGIYAAIFSQYIIRLIEDGHQYQYLPWLRYNIDLGWSNRNTATNLTYKDFANPCPTGVMEVYDASAVPALMQVIPEPSADILESDATVNLHGATQGITDLKTTSKAASYTNPVDKLFSIVVDNSTAITEGVTQDKVSVYSVNHQVVVDSATPVKVDVLTVDGKLVYSQKKNSDQLKISLLQGFYIVKVGNQSIKVKN